MRRKLKERSPGLDARRQNARLELVSGETVVGAAIRGSFGGLLWHRFHQLFDYQRRSLPRHHAIPRELLRRAHENALSRVLAEIHYRANIQEGLKMGQCIRKLRFSELFETSALAALYPFITAVSVVLEVPSAFPRHRSAL